MTDSKEILNTQAHKLGYTDCGHFLTANQNDPLAIVSFFGEITREAEKKAYNQAIEDASKCITVNTFKRLIGLRYSQSGIVAHFGIKILKLLKK